MEIYTTPPSQAQSETQNKHRMVNGQNHKFGISGRAPTNKTLNMVIRKNPAERPDFPKKYCRSREYCGFCHKNQPCFGRNITFPHANAIRFRPQNPAGKEHFPNFPKPRTQAPEMPHHGLSPRPPANPRSHPESRHKWKHTPT